jgi:hypothetical protein
MERFIETFGNKCQRSIFVYNWLLACKTVDQLRASQEWNYGTGASSSSVFIAEDVEPNVLFAIIPSGLENVPFAVCRRLTSTSAAASWAPRCICEAKTGTYVWIWPCAHGSNNERILGSLFLSPNKSKKVRLAVLRRLKKDVEIVSAAINGSPVVSTDFTARLIKSAYIDTLRTFVVLAALFTCPLQNASAAKLSHPRDISIFNLLLCSASPHSYATIKICWCSPKYFFVH